MNQTNIDKPPTDSAERPAAHPASPASASADAVPAVPAPAKPAKAPDVVVFKGVTKSFGEGDKAKVAIQDVSFAVEDLPNIGELITLVGPSGCGKSTLLRIIAGLKPHFPPTHGEVLVFDKPVHEPGPDRGLVDQKYSLLPHLTVKENIAFGLKLRGVPRAERLDQAQDWVKKVGLEGSERKFPSELSGGMQQRVAIARALVCEPDVLLMDEPFSAVDAMTRALLQDLLLRIWTTIPVTILFVTHDVDEAVFLSERVISLGRAPSGISDDIAIGLPAPRDQIATRADERFIALRQRLFASIFQQEQQPAPEGS